jgi:hypothetical protein|nr:MAG TPA: hypothetical protein [Caudoviricetes sp.]
MVDFNYFLNRQGIQGRKGDKGDAGFTPAISVSEQTLNSYKLKITNEYNEFETPNLIGNLGVTDNGGTYLRYDPSAGTVSAGEIDGATTETVGGVRKSTDADLTNLSADTVVTPANVADMLPLMLEAGSDNVTITQDEATSKTKISVEGGSGSGDVTAAGDNRFTGDNTFIGKVNIAGGALTVDGLANLNQTTAQYLNAVNITSSGEINAVSIKATGLRSDDIQTTENKKYLTEVDVDNQTIQVVEGKLHCNLDELGNEVNDLTGRVTANEADISAMKTGKQNKLTAGANVTLTDLTDGTVRIDATGGGGTGDIPIATTTTAGKVKPDGTTITITNDGTISAVGSSAPENMVTTDTAQTITGIKTFQKLYIKELNTAGSIEMYANHGLIARNNVEDSTSFQNTSYLETRHGIYTNTASMRFGEYDTSSSAQKISSYTNGSGSYGNLILEANSNTSDKSSLKLTKNSLTFTASDGTVTNLLTGGGGGVTIDDNTTTTTSVWSSSKTNAEITTVANEVVQTQGNVASLDGDVSTLKTDVSGLKITKQDTLTASDTVTVDMVRLGSEEALVTHSERTSTIEFDSGACTTVTRHNLDLRSYGGNIVLQPSDITVQDPMTLESSTIKGKVVDDAGKAYLKQDTVTAGDNITITNTATGVQISGATNEYIAHMAMPSDKSIDLTLGASGTIYTAPADGWFTAAVSGITLLECAGNAPNTSSPFYGCNTSTTTPDENLYLRLSLPVSKGQTIFINYTGTAITKLLKFVYAKGAEPTV